MYIKQPETCTHTRDIYKDRGDRHAERMFRGRCLTALEMAGARHGRKAGTPIHCRVCITTFSTHLGQQRGVRCSHIVRLYCGNVGIYFFHLCMCI